MRTALSLMAAIAAAVFCIVLLPAFVVADDEPRFALLVGNQDYPNDPGALQRLHADVATLRAAGVAFSR